MLNVVCDIELLDGCKFLKINMMNFIFVYLIREFIINSLVWYL